MAKYPHIRVSKEAYAVINMEANKHGRPMTKQLDIALGIVSYPDNGKEVIDGMALIERDGDKTIISEVTMIEKTQEGVE